MCENARRKTADRLRQCREEAHETLDYIGRLVGVNKSTVLRWERGETTKINLPTLQRLAQHFGVDAAWLAGENVPRNGGWDWLSEHAVGMNDLADSSVSDSRGDRVRQTNDAFADLLWSESYPSDGLHFWLKVTGDSMEPLMNEGDLVLVRRQSSVENGQFALLLWDGRESMIRRVWHRENGLELQSINPYYPPRTLSENDLLRINILGVILESKRKFV